MIHWDNNVLITIGVGMVIAAASYVLYFKRESFFPTVKLWKVYNLIVDNDFKFIEYRGTSKLVFQSLTHEIILMLSHSNYICYIEVIPRSYIRGSFESRDSIKWEFFSSNREAYYWFETYFEEQNKITPLEKYYNEFLNSPNDSSICNIR